MHPTQKKLVELGQKHDLSSLGLREIGRMIGEPHPQKIKHHLKQMGLLKEGSIGEHENQPRSALPAGVLSIPVIGLANCGEAAIFAEPHLEKHLSVSKKLINQNSADGIFAVQAVGNSMNRAKIQGKSIQDGDYVIVDSKDRDFKTDDYVLSSINNLANIKKLVVDEDNDQILLTSESSEEFPPIFIHAGDFDEYVANGKVIAVLKQPRGSNEMRFEPVV